MNKDFLSGRQLMSIASLIIIGEAVILGAYMMPITGAWLAMLFAVLFTFILCFIYGYGLKKFPDMDIYDIFLKLFGKFFGRLFIILFLAYAFLTASILIGMITVFIIRLTFMETPNIVIGIALVAFSAILLKNGIEVFARIMTIIFQLLVIILIFFIFFLISEMDFGNLLPLVAAPFSEIIKGSIFNVCNITGDVVILFGLMGNVRKDPNVHFKAFSMANAIAGTIFIVLIMATIAALDLPFAYMVHFPTHLSFSVINIGNFFTRIEIVASTFLITASICKYCVFLFVASRGIQKLFNGKKTKSFIIPVGILTFFFAREVFKNLYRIYKFRENFYWGKLFFQIVIPIMIAIIATFIKEKQKPKTSIMQLFKKS